MKIIADSLKYCWQTLSSRAFYYIVCDALLNNKSLSAVRVADGEKALLDWCLGKANPIIATVTKESWMKRYGVDGISKEELKNRILMAGDNCDYFAPSTSGVENELYSLWEYFDPRSFYIEHFFNHDWTTEMKTELFKMAGHVLVIHGNAKTADSMQLRVQANLAVKVSYIKLSHWSESQDVIEKSRSNTAPLVIFSGGPASKYIANEIAVGGNKPKVVLDLGVAMQRWTFEHLPANRKRAEEFHKNWSTSNKIFDLQTL